LEEKGKKSSTYHSEGKKIRKHSWGEQRPYLETAGDEVEELELGGKKTLDLRSSNQERGWIKKNWEKAFSSGTSTSFQ